MVVCFKKLLCLFFLYLYILDKCLFPECILCTTILINSKVQLLDKTRVLPYCKLKHVRSKSELIAVGSRDEAEIQVIIIDEHVQRQCALEVI